MPVILAFLQNQWFKNPEKVKAMYARHPELRNELIRRFLFAGCLTGQRLRKAFGSELCGKIIWEEISPEIGGHASSRFPADYAHMFKAICVHKPNIIIALGTPAQNAVAKLLKDRALPCMARVCADVIVVAGMHPAARYGIVMANLDGVARNVREAIDRTNGTNGTNGKSEFCTPAALRNLGFDVKPEVAR